MKGYHLDFLSEKLQNYIDCRCGFKLQITFSNNKTNAYPVLLFVLYLYVTAKNGATEAELEDILSCDDDVLNDVYMYWTPPMRRLPPLLLVRVRTDINQYLGVLPFLIVEL